MTNTALDLEVRIDEHNKMKKLEMKVENSISASAATEKVRNSNSVKRTSSD